MGLFEVISQKLLQGAGTIRRLGLIFMLLCFFSAMLVTNDVALLTFVPLTLLVFAEIEGVDEKHRIFVIGDSSTFSIFLINDILQSIGYTS